jgi:hypothetical protein
MLATEVLAAMLATKPVRYHESLVITQKPDNLTRL